MKRNQSLLFNNRTGDNLLKIIWQNKLFQGPLEKLFEDFDEATILTFSSSCKEILAFFYDLGYKKLNLLLGLPNPDDVISKIFNPNFVQKVLDEFNTDVEADRSIMEKMSSNDYRILVPDARTHAKIFYLKSSSNGKERIIWGSANMTKTALSGRQYEILEVLDESGEGEYPPDSKFGVLKGVVTELLQHSKPFFTSKFVKKKLEQSVLNVTVDEELLDEFSKNVLEHARAIVVDEKIAKILEEHNETLFKQKKEEVSDFETGIKMLRVYVKRTKSGFKPISQREYLTVKRKNKIGEVLKVSTKTKVGLFTDVRPQILCNNEFLYINGKPLGMKLDDEELKVKLSELNKLLLSYRELTEEELPSKIVFETILYAFTSPFLYKLREIFVSCEEKSENLGELCIFAYIAGSSHSGKTFLLKEICRLISGSDVFYYHYFPKAEFPVGGISSRGIMHLLEGNNLFPVLVDEIPPQYFTSVQSKPYEGTQTLKALANRRRDHHPCLIATGNVNNFDPPGEIARRVYYLPLSKSFRKERIKEVTQKLGEYHLDNSLFMDFVYHFSNVLLELNENDERKRELCKQLSDDFLVVGRRIMKEWFERTRQDVPFWFNEKNFGQTLLIERNREFWKHTFKILMSDAVVYRDQNTDKLLISFEYTASLKGRDKDKAKLIKKLPDYVKLENVGDQMLLVKADEFFEFLKFSEKEKNYALKKMKHKTPTTNRKGKLTNFLRFFRID